MFVTDLIARVKDRVWAKLRDVEITTRHLDPVRQAVLAARWESLPPHVRTPAQIVGRRSVGCEGTHGVFPQCDFTCTPCYHSADANRVRVDGPHTIREIDRQMRYLMSKRGPVSHAQLIGGEVSLLEPNGHAAAIDIMRSFGRMPMSFSHGDFSEEYLHQVTLHPDGTPRHRDVSWAVHIDTTMRGRSGAPKPKTERELDPFRQQVCDMFERLRRDHGIRSYLAHNMTVTPGNLGQVAEMLASCKGMGFRMFSFQPAAYVGNERRWEPGFREVTDDLVWAEIERGIGRSVPFGMIQFGDVRCNRTSWGVLVGGRFVPVLEEGDPADERARDALYDTFPGNWMGVPPGVKVAKFIRSVARRPSVVPIALSWVARLVRRAGGIRAFRGGVQPITIVMHSFIDARDVAPAWELLQQGIRSEEPAIRAAQERLEACVYTMAHPDDDELVPACVQHSILDPQENRQLVQLLPVRRRTVKV